MCSRAGRGWPSGFHRRRARLRGHAGAPGPASGGPLLRQGGREQGALDGRAAPRDIEVVGGGDGPARVRLHGAVAARAAALGVVVHISLTHTNTTAAAVACSVTLPPGSGPARPRAHARDRPLGHRGPGHPRPGAHGAGRAGPGRLVLSVAAEARSRSSAARATTAATGTSSRGCCATPGAPCACSPWHRWSELRGDARANAERVNGVEPFEASRLETARAPSTRCSARASRHAARRSRRRHRRPERRRAADGRRRRAQRGRRRDRRGGGQGDPGTATATFAGPSRGCGSTRARARRHGTVVDIGIPARRAGARARRGPDRRRGAAGAAAHRPRGGLDEVHEPDTCSSPAARAA